MSIKKQTLNEKLMNNDLIIHLIDGRIINATINVPMSDNEMNNNDDHIKIYDKKSHQWLLINCDEIDNFSNDNERFQLLID